MHNNIVRWLQKACLVTPDKFAFIHLEDGEGVEKKITYKELNTRVCQLGSWFIQHKNSNRTSLLIYQDFLEFIVCFLACQYADVIPVPVFFSSGSKHRNRLKGIIEDSGADLIMTTLDLERMLKASLAGYLSDSADLIVYTSSVTDHDVITNDLLNENEISFIQYTSGSTENPKGVKVSKSNLIHNQELIMRTFNCNHLSVIFSWLPFHHDMGLIGNILQSIYVGCTCVTMSPFHFIQKPERWLNAISKYKITHSGGPNFSFDLCVDKYTLIGPSALDLSSWKVAYNGSESVRAETIDQFSSKFESNGFDIKSFYPCYGLAEATLLVSGMKANKAPARLAVCEENLKLGKLVFINDTTVSVVQLVSSGSVAEGMDLKILVAGQLLENTEPEFGEICISGRSVTSGYLNKNNADFFIDHQGELFFKTGDTGFIHNNELYVYGRIKEMFIVRGQNYYPYDIEKLVSRICMEIAQNGVVVFSIDDKKGEQFVVVAEIKRVHLNSIDAAGVIESINTGIGGSIGAEPLDIILTTPLGIPRTTSGKLQRLNCRNNYLENELNIIGSKLMLKNKSGEKRLELGLLEEVIHKGNYSTIKKYLVKILESKIGAVSRNSFSDKAELAELGLDSLRLMEVLNMVNKDLNINLDATKVYQVNNLSGLINLIENLLWLKKDQSFGEEINL